MPFSLLKLRSALMPVSLSCSLMMGTFAFLMGSIDEQMPDLASSLLIRLIIVLSFADGQYTIRSISELGRFKPVAHEPKTRTFALGKAFRTTSLMRSTTSLRRCFSDLLCDINSTKSRISEWRNKKMSLMRRVDCESHGKFAFYYKAKLPDLSEAFACA